MSRRAAGEAIGEGVTVEQATESESSQRTERGPQLNLLRPDLGTSGGALRPCLRRLLLTRIVRFVTLVLILWLLVAYTLAPMLWRRYEKRHPALDNAPRI